jgi:hypothetical protein
LPNPTNPKRTGRKPIPDEFYAVQLREQLATTGELIFGAPGCPALVVDQERARRLVVMVRAERGGVGGSLLRLPVNGLYYASLMRSSPPLVTRGEDAVELRDMMIRAQADRRSWYEAR